MGKGHPAATALRIPQRGVWQGSLSRARAAQPGPSESSGRRRVRIAGPHRDEHVPQSAQGPKTQPEHERWTGSEGGGGSSPPPPPPPGP